MQVGHELLSTSALGNKDLLIAYWHAADRAHAKIFCWNRLEERTTGLDGLANLSRTLVTRRSSVLLSDSLFLRPRTGGLGCAPSQSAYLRFSSLGTAQNAAPGLSIPNGHRA